MKKIVLIPALLTASLVFAKANVEVTPLVGYSIPDSAYNLDNAMMYGAELQYNGTSTIKPEVSFFYTALDPKVDTNIDYSKWSANLNGVYEFTKKYGIQPLVKAGIGASTVTNSEDSDTDGSINLNLGAGLKIPVTEMLSFKAEAIYKPTYDNEDIYHDFALLAGFNFHFGQGATKKMVEEDDTISFDADNDGVIDTLDKCANTPQGVKVDEDGCKIEKKKAVVPLDSDHDGVIDLEDLCADTPAGVDVDSNGCIINKDSDHDGIEDAQDSCPNTPAGVKVDVIGCQVEVDSDNDGVVDSQDDCPNTELGVSVDTRGCALDIEQVLKGIVIRFGYKYTELTPESKDNVDKLVMLLDNNPNLHINILGYTDSIASQGYNLILSQKRADKIKNMLIERGIAADRLNAIGKGESNPIASNATEEGRAKNRRIEIEVAN